MKSILLSYTFRTAAILLLIILSTVLSGCGDSQRQQHETESAEERELILETRVAFLTESGDTISAIRAAVADDNESRTQGLMNVTNLPQDAGMLFIFKENQPRSFWMASTLLSLDIIFANSDFEIVRIHRNTSPFSQEGIPSERPAKYVVEVNAGYTLRHDIFEGAKIQFEP